MLNLHSEYQKKHYLDLKKLIDLAEQYYKFNPKKLKQLEKDNLEKAKRQYHREYNHNREKENKYKREWRLKNIERERERNRLWYKNNREKAITCHEKWRKNNMESIREFQNKYQNDRRKTDLKYNLNKKISGAIGISLKGNKNGLGWESLVGYTLNDLLKRLKKTMPVGYTWQDFLNGDLHIDHIIPISVFNFTRPEHIDFKRCWALSNLRLLPAKENLIKHNHLDRPFQLALKI
ncbi:hypothetical protein ES705_29629 [subsurface metagenome]